MIHTTPDFFNKVATEIRAKYFPNEVHHHTLGTPYQKTTQAIELFNNGCLTYRQLIGRLSKSCGETTEKIHQIVEKYVVSFGSYTYKPSRGKYIAVAVKGDYLICLSKPCSKKQAEKFRGCEMRGEKFEIKTETEVKNHKKVLQ